MVQEATESVNYLLVASLQHGMLSWGIRQRTGVVMSVNLASPLSTVFARLRIPSVRQFTPEISEIEQNLADKLSRLCSVEWHQQVPVETPFCVFFLDMGCLISPGRAIGIECDGRGFHQDKVRDFCRDALILGTGRLARIYRIQAWAIRKCEPDWLRVLSELEPGLFRWERLQVIKEVGYGYDRWVGQQLQNRSARFISWLDPETEAVIKFLEFARANDGISFPKLVKSFRQV